MNRSGFSMLELMFVIVLLGILSAVAIPKLLGTKAQADEINIKSFVGVLNRTVGGAKWASSISNDNNGSISSSLYNITTADTQIPDEINANSFDMTKCTTALAPIAPIATGSIFDIVCRDGNQTNPPRFWYKESSAVYVNFDHSVLKL